MSLTIEQWCKELLRKANGDRIPDGNTMYDEEYKYNDFACAGYRNTDVINSMIAYYYMEQNPNEMEYIKWLKQHTDPENLSDALDVVGRAVDYMWKYRQDPIRYIICTGYLSPDQLNEMANEWNRR